MHTGPGRRPAANQPVQSVPNEQDRSRLPARETRTEFLGLGPIPEPRRQRLTMSPENWRRVERIYEEALEKSPHEREQFLDTACVEDSPDVRAKVEELLRSPEEDKGGIFDEVRRRVGAFLPTE